MKMKAFFYLLAVSILTAIFLALHEYTVTNDLQKARQLFARSICISLIVTGAIVYYISGTSSLMQEPFDTVSRPSMTIPQEIVPIRY